MILIPRIKFFILNLTAMAGILFLGIMGYVYVSPSSKSEGETFFFVSLLIAGLVFIMFLKTLSRSRNISKEMDRLIHLSSIGGFTPGTSLKRLGKLGKQIDSLYYHLSTMNKKRALKITAQSTLIDFLATNSAIPLAVTDPTGEILYTSRVFLEKSSTARTEITGKNITSVFPELDMQTVTGDIESSHTFTEYSEGKETVEIYPITSKYGEISYLIFIFGKHGIQFSHKKTEKEQPLHSFLRKIVSR